ncbi:MAG TPA: choice-of-anchor E domain-containing protein [Tepidiformaceae bacterium]|nr:choice-of-anchor E domain-containing protein [Tepidiformaceae bacterium]
MAYPSARSRIRRFHAPGLPTVARIAAAFGVVLAGVPVAVAGGMPRTAEAANCPIISGYVYYDVNNNGIKDGGEPPIPGSSIELRKSNGQVAGFTYTDGSGFYSFTTDASANTPQLSVTHTATFPTAVTDWTVSKSIPRFDTTLGTLKAVELRGSATITSSIKAESLDSASSTITANVSGIITVTGPGGQSVAVAPNAQAGTFDAAAFDGNKDFAGPSGKDFGSSTASDTNTVIINDPAALIPFLGTGNLTFTGDVVATSKATGSGNVASQINTTAGGDLTVTYRYIQSTCLTDGNYTIVQTQQPAGYTDGRETRGNVTPISGSERSDSISVTIANGDSTQNNFGELRAGISGYVYWDQDNDGNKDTGEPPIPGTTILLACVDSSGANVNRSTVTNGLGYYEFTDLLAGLCELNENQPAPYLDGKDTIGTPGGSTGNDRFFNIQLPAGFFGVNNNFGEILPTNSTPPVTFTGTPSSTPPGGTQTPQPTCVPGTSGCPNTPTPPPPGTCVPGTNGCPPSGQCTPGVNQNCTPVPTQPPAGQCTPGTPGCPPSGQCTPGSSPNCTPIAGQTNPANATPGKSPSPAGNKVPSAPDSGTGFLDHATSFNTIMIGLAVFAASGWLAFLALGKRKQGDEPAE